MGGWGKAGQREAVPDEGVGESAKKAAGRVTGAAAWIADLSDERRRVGAASWVGSKSSDTDPDLLPEITTR
jgi:hypothetical protein